MLQILTYAKYYKYSTLGTQFVDANNLINSSFKQKIHSQIF